MGRLFNLLKAAQIQLTGPLGYWAQNVSSSLDAILTALGIPAGGGSGASLELDILETRRSGLDQIGVGAGSDVIQNNLLFVRGQATYDSNTGIYTLIPGKIYELDASGPVGSFSDATAGFLEISWVDALTNVPLGTDIPGIYKPSTQTNASSSGDRTRCVYLPTAAGNAQVKLRVTAATGTANIPAPYFGAVVKQLR